MESAIEQAETALRAMTRADIDLGAKVMLDPAAMTIAEQRTLADRLGLKNPLLRFATEVVSDPIVWVSFLMDKRFPMLGWLKGQIPNRFVGAANEFSGISAVSRPVETYFRGTPIPRLVALQQQREAEVRKIGARMLDVMDRPNWAAEMPIVSMMLEGRPVAGATPELKAVGQQLRKGMDEIWRLLRQTKKIHGGVGGEPMTAAWAEDFAAKEAPRYLRDYLPHIPLLGEASIIQLEPAEAVRALTRGKTRQILEAARANPHQVWSVSHAQRLESDFTRYQSFLNATQGQVFNPNLFHRQRLNIPLQSLEGQELFVTDLNVILQKYVHTAARTYGLNAPLSAHERALATVVRPDGTRIIPSDEPIVVQIINEGLKATGARMVERPVAGTARIDRQLVRGSENPLMLTALQRLVKNMRGDADMGEIMMGNLLSTVGRRFDQAAIDAGYKEKASVDFAMRKLMRDRQWRGIMNGVTSHFYASTLGLNPWSAIQNLLQPVLTTMPAIGIGPTLKGVSELRARIPRYARTLAEEFRLARGRVPAGTLTRPEAWIKSGNEAAQRAFNKVFPELAEAGLKLDPRLFDIDPRTTTAFGPRARRVFRSYDDLARWMLQPFTHAEMANQVTTFYGARHNLIQKMRIGTYEVPLDIADKPLTGKALDTWLNFESGITVNATQFRPGPGGRSLLQSLLPAPLRMFTSFPTRALSFMVESTVRGAMTDEQLKTAGLLSKLTGGRNLGTLARMILYGRVLQHGVGEVLGLDLRRALGPTAPFTFTPQGEFLSPFPIPPVAGAVAGVVSAAANRDIKEMRPMYVPGVGRIPIPRTLFPGGVAISRMTRAVQHWRPDLGGFVDDDERLMYRGNTTDLILAMMGVPTEKNRRTRNYLERTQSVRSRVRDFRRAYARAYANYDFGTMDTLQGQWQKAFPDWPALSITAKDARRYMENSRMPVLNRMLETMGAAGRYLEGEIYELDPELLAPRIAA